MKFLQKRELPLLPPSRLYKAQPQLISSDTWLRFNTAHWSHSQSSTGPCKPFHLGGPLPQAPGMPPRHLLAASGAHSSARPWKTPGTLWKESWKLKQRESLQSPASRPCLLCPCPLSSIWSILRQDSSPKRETHKKPQKRCQQICTFQKQSHFQVTEQRDASQKRCDLISQTVKQP